MKLVDQNGSRNLGTRLYPTLAGPSICKLGVDDHHSQFALLLIDMKKQRPFGMPIVTPPCCG